MRKTASVVICSHNPREDYLKRVLTALKGQTLPFDNWELLLIDNASVKPLANRFDLSWHPYSRCVVEEELGLTSARLRGINESCGDLIVFVDDDNILAPDYLASAIEVATTSLHIGAFGGSIRGEFEIPPQPWASPYLHLLAVREIHRDSWSNLLNVWNDSVPCGAGLCIRRSVALDYMHKSSGDRRRRALGRVGTGTGSSEDVDLAYCAIDLGMGTGTFCRLKVTHLIPAARLTVEYIARLNAGIYASDPVLKSLRPTETSVPRRDSAGIRFWVKFVARLVTCSKIDRTIAIAMHAGRRSGQRFLRETSKGALIQH